MLLITALKNVGRENMVEKRQTAATLEEYAEQTENKDGDELLRGIITTFRLT